MTKHQQSTEQGVKQDMMDGQSTDQTTTHSAEPVSGNRNDEPGNSSQGGADTASAPSTDGEIESENSASSAREAELEAHLKDTENRLARALADFDNYRRRTRQEHEDLQKFASRKVLEGLLPVVDNFERALSALTGQEVPGEIQTGIEMVYRQLQNLLTQQGVAAMDAVGKPFDPQIHEAVMQESAEGQGPGIVVQELQKGYLLHDKVLRPAMVKVTV